MNENNYNYDRDKRPETMELLRRAKQMRDQNIRIHRVQRRQRANTIEDLDVSKLKLKMKKNIPNGWQCEMLMKPKSYSVQKIEYLDYGLERLLPPQRQPRKLKPIFGIPCIQVGNTWMNKF